MIPRSKFDEGPTLEGPVVNTLLRGGGKDLPFPKPIGPPVERKIDHFPDPALEGPGTTDTGVCPFRAVIVNTLEVAALAKRSHSSSLVLQVKSNGR